MTLYPRRLTANSSFTLLPTLAMLLVSCASADEDGIRCPSGQVAAVVDEAMGCYFDCLDTTCPSELYECSAEGVCVPQRSIGESIASPTPVDPIDSNPTLNNTSPDMTSPAPNNTVEDTGPPDENPPTDSPDPNDPCMGIDYLGECQGSVVVYCKDNTLKRVDCNQYNQSCGWIDEQTGYYCGGSSTTPDDDGETTPPDASGCGEPLENEVIDLANSSRASNGVGALTCDDALTRAARGHSQDMCDRNYFSHTSPEGSQPWDRAKAAGAQFSVAGENIAWGYSSPQSVHTGWMNSPGHRRNLLKSGYSRIGVGHVDCGGKNYWTQVFSD